MPSPFDTIVAPITGAHSAPVAIVRVSGGEAWRVASRVFKPWPSDVTARHAIYGTFASGDDGIALPFSEGHSYTGEESVELSCHGSRAAVRALVEACVAGGARLAEPGEFTQRAFLNGRIDLTQAEAIRDTIEADTDLQLRLANLHRDGALRREIEAIRNELTGLLTAVEASVDFGEEVGPLDRTGAIELLQALEGGVQRLLRTSDTGRILRQGLRIAIVGPPNAGKSSLLNALLGADRAIVTDIPGTTRDFVEERIELGGLPAVLIDTAGLREPQDPVEAIGIQRTRAIAANVDEVWYVYDASLGWTADDRAEAATFERPVIVVANKADLVDEAATGIPVSALHCRNLELLVSHTRKRVEGLFERDHVAIDLRHAKPLRRTLDAIRDAIGTLAGPRPDDLAAVSLRDAISRLGEVTGEAAAPDMIERIFRDFCIGK